MVLQELVERSARVIPQVIHGTMQRFRLASHSLVLK